MSPGCLKSALVENPNIASAAGLQSTNPFSSSNQQASAESSNNTRYLFLLSSSFLAERLRSLVQGISCAVLRTSFNPFTPPVDGLMEEDSPCGLRRNADCAGFICTPQLNGNCTGAILIHF